MANYQRMEKIDLMKWAPMINKPHYIFKSGKWWVFKSRKVCAEFFKNLKDNRYIPRLQPRLAVMTECGLL